MTGLLKIKKIYSSIKEKRNRLRNYSLAYKSIKTSLVRFYGKGVGYISRILSTHLVSSITIGINEIIISLSNRLVPFLLFGLDEFLQIFLADPTPKSDNTHKKGYFYVVRLVSIISSLVGIFIIWQSQWIATFIFKKPNLALAFKILGVLLPILTLQKINVGALIGLKKPASASLIEVALTPTFLILMLIIGYFARLLTHMYSLAYFYAIAVFMTFLIGSYLVMKNLKSGIGDFFTPVTKPRNLIHLTGKIYSFMLITTIGETLLTIVQGRFLTLTNFAIFKVLKRLTNITSIPTTSIVNTIAPHLVHAYTENKTYQAQRLRNKSLKILFFTLTPIFAILILFPWLLTFLLGGEFKDHSILTILLVLNAYIIDITSPFSISLRMAQKQNLMGIAALAGYSIAIALNLLLIPKFNMVGVAVADLFNTVVQKLLLVFMVYYFKL